MPSETHIQRQNKKFAFFYGTINQDAFYKSLEDIPDISIVAKFNQSGFSGFLPFYDNGVCAFFTLDYTRATNEGRAHEWIKRIEERDQQFIHYLIAERNELYEFAYSTNTVAKQLISLSELNRKAANLPSHTNPLKNVGDNYQLDFLPMPDSAENCALIIAEKMSPQNYNSHDTCMEAPHLELVFNASRKGILASSGLGHSLVFSMATTEQGGLDPAHIICIDANAGAFKIKNDPETIRKFMVAFDEQLVGELDIGSYMMNQVTVKSIPQKGTEHWKYMKKYIQADQHLGNNANYLLSDLHQLNEFLRQQVEKLIKSRHSDWIPFFRDTFENKTDEKITMLKKIHENTQVALARLFQPGVNVLEYNDKLIEITKRMYLDTKDAVQMHRKFFSCGRTESEHQLEQLNISII